MLVFSGCFPFLCNLEAMTRLADHVSLMTKNDLTPTKEQTSSGEIKTTRLADIFLHILG